MHHGEAEPLNRDSCVDFIRTDLVDSRSRCLESGLGEQKTLHLLLECFETRQRHFVGALILGIWLASALASFRVVSLEPKDAKFLTCFQVGGYAALSRLPFAIGAPLA